MVLYIYFENQPAILPALAERETGKLRARQEEFERRAEREDIVAVMRAALEFFPQFERENPNLFHLAWVAPQSLPGEMELANERSRKSIEHLARLVRLGIERGAFKPREPMIAAAAAMGMVVFPLLMFHNGRIADPLQRDRLVAEMLNAAMGYLCTFGGEKDQNMGKMENQLSMTGHVPGVQGQPHERSGWSYRVRQLEQEESFVVQGKAHLIQDEFENSYQREN